MMKCPQNVGLATYILMAPSLDVVFSRIKRTLRIDTDYAEIKVKYKKNIHFWRYGLKWGGRDTNISPRVPEFEKTPQPTLTAPTVDN